jgi:tetratricopeptide (TPR) repeat protein
MCALSAVASASADLLRDLVPGSGHLVHMPSHTYIRSGRYHDGIMTNLQAVLVDSLYTVACHAQGVYPLAYYPHNYHFLATWAILQHYYTIPIYINVKLGRWQEIQASSEPPDWFFSVHHNLGAVLIEAGKYADAVKVYNEDLNTFPENGWALIGLMNAYSKLGEKNKYIETKNRFDAAWKYADIKISSSRIL